jgi:hypothetical protein
MRRSTTRWLAFLATPLIALSCARTVRADPIPYSSSGEVGVAGGYSIGNFSLDSTNGTLLGPGSLALASFQAPTMPSGTTRTFTDMPFYINVVFYPNGQNTDTDTSVLSIQGLLNGTLTGPTSSNVLGSSNVVATVTTVDSTGLNALPFSLNSFDVLTPQTLAPSGINGGMTSLIGQVTAMATPEPTPLAFLGILAVGTALRSGVRRIRQSRTSAPRG